MRLTLLKSKIHRATVSDTDLDDEGSISIDPKLAMAAHLVPFERVEIHNVTNGERFATHYLEGEVGSSEITINGAAAHKAKKRDIVVICCYAEYEEDEAVGHRPRLVYVDEHNHILRRKKIFA